MESVQEMLLKNKQRLKQENAAKCPTERVCLCGTVVKYEDLSPSQKRYKKFRCTPCENERKSKYRKPKKGEGGVGTEEIVESPKAAGE